MKQWDILNKIKNQKSKIKNEDLIELLLENRGIKSKKEKGAFLNPALDDVTSKTVGIDKTQLKKTLERIKRAIDDGEQIVVFGDYDVDGITGAAIIWETLHDLNAKIMPHIPHRIDEGYGLSVVGINNIKAKYPDLKLIITVDNGIVAHEAVDYANSLGIDVVITDHHVADEVLPKAYSIVHTTRLCGAGVAYLLSQELKVKSEMLKVKEDSHLELAALGTIADMVPLTNSNRAIVKHGLLKILRTKRIGLQELFKQAGLNKEYLTPYEVGYIIAPRLNAAGRIESGMDSLRLLCTKDPKRAKELAQSLELINKERQQILKDTTIHAIQTANNQVLIANSLIFVAHETYQPGVIGLVAGKLVEAFYRPAIVLSIGETHTKASARSISGFNIIEFLRSHSDHFVNVGGHPMAAGFTVETEKIKLLKDALVTSAEKLLTQDILIRRLYIDCELLLDNVSNELYNKLQALSPFGIGNPEPTFVSYGVEIKNFKILGKERNHLKLTLKKGGSEAIDAIGFGMGEIAETIKPGDKLDIVYTIDENVWNGNANLQLKIKDIKLI